LLALLRAHPILHVSRIRVKRGLEEIGSEGVDWSNLAEYRDQWQTDVNMVIDLHIS